MDSVKAQDIVDTVTSSLLVLDLDLRVHSANRAFYRTFAVDSDATIGRPLFELGNGQWDIPDLRRLLVEVVPRDGTVEGYEVGHDFPDIGVKCMRLNARKVFRPGNHVPFLLLAIDDITNEHEARDDAERQGRLALSIVDTVRDPMVVLRDDMTVAAASRAFVLLFGDEDGDLVGRSLYDLAQGKWKVGRLQDLLARVVPDDTALDGFEVEDEFPGLGRRIFKLNARKVHRPGSHITQLLLAFEDVTEARLLERHRDLLAAELAHRIKNSLQIITSFVSYEIRRAAEPCIAGYQAMQARIGAVAGLYDVISRSASLGPVSVGPYLEGIADSLRASLLGTETGIRVEVEAEPLSIVSDHAVTIGLIVNELATNAVKHAFPEGRGRIVLGFARRDGAAVLTVADDGIGLAATTGSNPASGKGSRFVEAFVRQVGGTLACATGKAGTTYTVRLPASILAGD